MKLLNNILLFLFRIGMSIKRPIKGSFEIIDDFRYSYLFGRTLMVDEQQYYSDGNVSKVNNTTYQFDIKKEHVFAKPQWDKPEMDFDYTSGMLFSNEKFLYGSFEAEIYIPKGYGLWSAFWLQGESEKGFTEIDIFEYYGKDHRFSYCTGYGIDYAHNLSKGGIGIHDKRLENSWNKYRVDWYEGKDIKIFVNDILVGKRYGKPFTIPMNLIINMAIRKKIGTKLDKFLPTKMFVRNIKYYK